jgi:hypothetical protein
VTADDRAFAVASDDALVALIEAARRRLVVIAPALSTRVAAALARRFDDLDDLDVRVILDADPEVYRLGFGEPAALDAIREAAARSLFDLREQPGVRIGVVVSDDDTMVFAPVSKNIEAGSSSADQPNAILLKGSPASRLAAAAGASVGVTDPEGEIGQRALAPEKVDAMTADLKRNPVASAATGLESTPRERKPSRRAAKFVVPRPQKGSSTTSPSRALRRKTLSGNSRGNIVK